MTIGIKNDVEPKKYALTIFREELGESLIYVDIPKLSAMTGIPYIRVWRLLRGKYDFKADDLIKILAALNRLDILNKICGSIVAEMAQTSETKKEA